MPEDSVSIGGNFSAMSPRTTAGAAADTPVSAPDAASIARALNGVRLREGVTVFLLLALVTVVAGIMGADLAIARACHGPGGWCGKDWPLGEALYRAGRGWAQPALWMAVAGLLVAAISIKVRVLRPHLKAALFFPLLLALGPGLLVNVALKDHWGRPRPCQLVEFGGTHAFREAWQPGDRGPDKTPSFPSGHASMAFATLAPWFVLRSRRRLAASLWLAGGLAFGALVGAARITQGGHFASDILWSGGAVYLTGLVLARAMRLDTGRASEKEIRHRPEAA